MFNATALNAYVKRTYDPKFISNEMLSLEDKMLRDIKKITDGSGDNFSWLTDADDDFNGSPDFAIAQAAAANNNNTNGSKFLSDWNDYSAVAQISESIIGKTRNNDGAWQKAVDVAMRKRMRSIAHANAVFLQGQGWGEVSDIDTVAGSTFKPKTRSDITKYVRGMALHFSQTLNANGLRSATVVYVTGVNYTVGQELVTCSATMASVGAVNNDFAFIAGAREDSATPTRKALIGFGAWCPNQNVAIDASNSTLLTVNRTLNSRLYGTFVDASGGGSVIGSLIDGATEALVMGNTKSLRCYCSKATFKDVAKDLHTAVQYMDNPNAKTAGTKKLTIVSGDDGEATLEICRTMNDNQIWGMDPGQVALKSIGGAPHISSDDGLTMCRLASSAGYETRWFQQAIYEFQNAPGLLRVQLV